jgi:hypothetical protein
MQQFFSNMKSVICSGINANSVNINGKTYTVPSGSSITIEGDKVTIGSQTVDIEDKIINITVMGDVGTAMSTSGQIKVTGNSGNIQSTSGNVSVEGNTGSINTVSGSVKVSGKVEGNISTVSGSFSL